MSKQRYVSKTTDGPCCSLLVINYEEFMASLVELQTQINMESSCKLDNGKDVKLFIILDSDSEKLKIFLISQVKYNISLLEKIVDDDCESVCSI